MMDSRFLLPLIILIEGFISIGIEILTIRQLLPVAGSSVIVTSLVIGILGGIIVGKLLFLILINLMKLDITISSSFSISLPAIIQTLLIYL